MATRRNSVNYILSQLSNGRWLLRYKTGLLSTVKVGTYATYAAAEKARSRDWKKRQKKANPSVAQLAKGIRAKFVQVRKVKNGIRVTIKR